MNNLNILLTQLQSAELVRPVTDADPAFTFKHALTQEMAYQSLLVKRRREIHRRVAEAYEDIYRERLDEFAALLAQHYAEAGDDAKTLDYAMRAGQRAVRQYANAEAVKQYSLAIDVAEREQMPRHALYRARGQAFETLGDFENARRDYEHALQTAREAQDGAGEWQSLIDLGFLWAGRNYEETGEFFRRADDLAQKLGEPKLHAHSLNRLGNWLANTGHPAEGVEAHRAALEIFQTLDDKRGLGETFDLLGMASWFSGDVMSGAKYLAQAIEILRDLDDKPALLSSLIAYAGLSGPSHLDIVVSRGRPAREWERNFAEAVALARQIGSLSNEAWVEFEMAWAYSSAGQFGRALHHGYEALRIANAIEHQQWQTAAHFSLGAIYVDLLQTEIAIQELQTALTLARQVGSVWWESNTSALLTLAHIQNHDTVHAAGVLDAMHAQVEAPRSFAERLLLYAAGELALARGEFDAAREAAEHLLTTAVGDTREKPIPDVLRLKGEALSGLKRTTEAEQSLEAAVRAADARDEPTRLWQIHRALGRLHQRARRTEQAKHEFAEAQAIVEQLAASIDDDALRENFSRSALKTFKGTNAARNKLTPRHKATKKK